MNILTELKKELGYANVTNQYIELATRTFQMDHGKESLQERARLVCGKETIGGCDPGGTRC